jgi:hypothetical protein
LRWFEKLARKERKKGTFGTGTDSKIFTRPSRIACSRRVRRCCCAAASRFVSSAASCGFFESNGPYAEITREVDWETTPSGTHGAEDVIGEAEQTAHRQQTCRIAEAG